MQHILAKSYKITPLQFKIYLTCYFLCQYLLDLVKKNFILEFLVFPIFYESISIPKNEFSKTIQSLWNIFMFCLA